MKAVHMDSWSIKEKLCLASAVAQEGDNDWAAVSRLLQPFLEPHRPADWFSERSCALQYNALLDKVDVPRRKKRSGPEKADSRTESPQDIIKKKLTDERIEELKRLMQLDKEQYLKDKEEIILINCGYLDDQLPTMWAEIQEEKRQKEQEARLHAQWLKDREERQRKIDLDQDWKPPVQGFQRRRKTHRPGRRRNSSQSSPGSEPDSTAVDSPLPELSKMDVLKEEPAESPLKARVGAPLVLVTSAPTPSSPLLTSLLKSPSPAPSSQASSILHSAITAQRGTSPTIVSLLSSAPGSMVPPPPTTVSPSLKNLVSSAIATASEEHLKPQSTSPSAGAPTLSMLLELPPSLPGKPLPELPSVARPPPPPAQPAVLPPHQPAPLPPALPPPAPPAPAQTPAPPCSAAPPGLETSLKGPESAVDAEAVEASIAEDLKSIVECDELIEEAVLEMVLASEDGICPDAAVVPVASDSTVPAVKVQGSWVRTLDFGGEVKEQSNEEDISKLKADDNGMLIVTTQGQSGPETEVELNAEKSFKDIPEREENDGDQGSEVIIEVVSAEDGKGDNGEVGSEVEVATKSEVDSSENYVEGSAEQGGVSVTDMTEEVFNIQEVEVAMSETVAEVVEIAGDESQSDLLPSELGDISEQQVLEVIVGPGQPDTDAELAVQVPEEPAGSKGQEGAVSGAKVAERADGAKTSHEVDASDDETGQRPATSDSTAELVEAKDGGSEAGQDVESDERKKQSDKQNMDEKSRSKKKKHSKGKKKKHSREKRNDSKNRSKEVDEKTDTKPSVDKEVHSSLSETKEKAKNDAKDSSRKRDDSTGKEISKREAAKEDKRSASKELSPERVRPKEGSKKVVEQVHKDKTWKENGRQVETVNSTDKRKKETDKNSRSSSKETETSRDVPHSSKEPSKKEKTAGSEKQHRGHRKMQDVKNSEVSKEENPRKDKKDVQRRETNKDTSNKKPDKNSDSEGSASQKEQVAVAVTAAATDEEDEKPLAEILDEKKHHHAPGLPYTKEERPAARSGEAHSGEEDKTSDAEPSKAASKKWAAASTPVDSVPNSPAPSVTTDEEREHKAWKKAIMLLYNRLATHKYASLFLRPITNDLAPGYSSYIYKPVDLQMIKKNIENGMIRTTTEFQKEVMRMFKNAIMYNKSLHDVHLMALEMQEECLQHIEDFVATQMLVASVGETPSRRETRTMDANKQREFLRSPRPSSHDEAEMVKPSKRKRNDTSSETPDHTPKRKSVED